MRAHSSCRRREESDLGRRASRPRSNEHRRVQVHEVLVHPRRYPLRTQHHQALLPNLSETATFRSSMRRTLKHMSGASVRIAGSSLPDMAKHYVRNVSSLHPLYLDESLTTVLPIPLERLPSRSRAKCRNFSITVSFFSCFRANAVLQ